MPLVSKYEITTVLPCVADTSKIRVIAKLDADIGEALPYLNATMKKVVFNPGGKTLTYKKEGMCFTFHENGITATKLRDLRHAHEELRAMLDQVNAVWERRAELTPSYERGLQLNALQIYKGLPATNCRECGELSCLAFAAKLLSGEVSVLACKPLFTPSFREKRVVLLELLEGAGYEIPAEFLA
jgi:ArsR family metal-binding transcriptional regulator